MSNNKRKPAVRSAKLRAPSPSRQLAAFIQKFEPSVARLIKQCRSELRKLLPTAIELVYDNYNFFVIGYSSTERPSGCIISLAAAANGVGLSFYRGATLPDPEHLLLGSGKQNRFVRLPSRDVLRSPSILKLIRAAIDQAPAPLAASGTGYTIFRSISARQRPRRRKTSSCAKPASRGGSHR